MNNSITASTPEKVPYVFVPLSGGQVAIIDAEDAERVLPHKWSIICPKGSAVYAQGRVTEGPGAKVVRYLHRYIMQAPKGMQVDHINNNGLDCRKANMRLATASENCRNRGKRVDGLTSSYKGVCLINGRWRASIGFRGTKKHIGYFDDEIVAARAYDSAAIELHGDFARLNFPEAL